MTAEIEGPLLRWEGALIGAGYDGFVVAGFRARYGKSLPFKPY